MASRLISITFVIVTVFSPIAARAQTGCLTGNVVDNNGQPVKEITVSLVEHTWRGDQFPVAHGASDESGEFRIDSIPPGAYQVGAGNGAPGYSGIWMLPRDVSISSSAVCTSITFNVGSPVAKLKLTVTDATTNKTTKDILLDVFPGEKPGVWFTVEPLLSYGVLPQVPSLTKLRIVVTAKGYSSSEFTFPSLAPGETREIVTKLTPRSLGCIKGVAVDDGLTPVVGAKIDPRFTGAGFAGDNLPVKADDAGKFTVDNLRPGGYVLYPDKESDGFSGNWSGWRGQVELQRVTVAAGGACQEVTVNMGARGALMQVRAFDAATHKPLLNISVGFRNPENTRQGGTVLGEPREPHEFLIPSRTAVDIQVRAPGYQPSEQVRVGPFSPGEKQDLTVALQRATTSTPVQP